MKHEFVVVGAGPSGSAAAASLALRGRDVLLIDRHDFPRDKICGDGIPPGTIELLNELGMAEKIRAAGFYPIHGLRIGSPWGRTWETRFEAKRPGLEFYIAPRKTFDALIYEHALECGVEFLRARVTGAVVDDQSRVTGVRVRGENGDYEISAGAVIAADGATSAMARSLEVDKAPPEQRYVGIRAYADGIDVEPNMVEFYFQKQLLPGYAWVFPLGEGRANVGLIVRADRFKSTSTPLRDRLDEFLAGDALGKRVRDVALEGVATWQLPIAIMPWRRRWYDGALLAGDAGGFVDPLTGEGIHFAVSSGMVAADVAHEAIGSERGRQDAGAVFATYDDRCQRSFGALVERSYRSHRWIDRAPVVLESLFVLANAAPGLTRRWINRVSTDFVVHE